MTRYIMPFELTTHHSSQTKHAYQQFYNMIGSLPDEIDRDNGREFCGEAAQWEADRNVIPKPSENYRADQNGGAEADVAYICNEAKIHLGCNSCDGHTRGR